MNNQYMISNTTRLGKLIPAMNQSQDWNSLLEKVGAEQDKASFSLIFEHYSPLLKAFLMKAGSVSPEKAEELVQDTMIKVWRKAPMFSKDQASASTWIYTIARNTRIDSIRSEARKNPDLLHADDIYDENEEVTPYSTLIRLRSKLDINQELKALPKEQFEVLSLMYFQGKSGQQVANTLEIPLGTVKSRIRLAMAKMKLGLGSSNPKEDLEEKAL